jgi:hypothetical protein
MQKAAVRLPFVHEDLAELPTPIDEASDAAISRWAENQIAKPEGVAEVEREFKRLRASGIIGPEFLRCGVVWVRLAAERGDVDEYKRRLGLLLQTWTWHGVIGETSARNVLPRLIEVRRTLPARVSGAGVAVLVNAAKQVLIEQTGADLSDADLSCEFAMLGDWALGHADKSDAKALCALSLECGERGGMGQHLLLAADLARSLGDEETASAIEVDLLKARCLPAVRIAPLLESMERRDVARALAVEAASYCQEPRVLKLASEVSDARTRIN